MEMTPNFKISLGITYKVWQFPSGEIGVKFDNKKIDVPTDEGICIQGSITSSDHIMELLQLVEHIRFVILTIPIHLIMPYCAYSRQDRRCNTGESFSLKIFADLINSCNFASVTTWDNHSDVSTALINNCNNIHVKDILDDNNNHSMIIVGLQLDRYDYFISPDAGANKKVFSCSQEFDIPMIRADKIRATGNGNIIDTKIYTEASTLKGKRVLIIDDICQGGRTFEELAKALKEKQPNVEIDLFVTHGFFNNGFNKMKEAGISKFITTDSVPQVHTCNELIVL